MTGARETGGGLHTYTEAPNSQRQGEKGKQKIEHGGGGGRPKVCVCVRVRPGHYG